jgi:hypothetical protein
MGQPTEDDLPVADPVRSANIYCAGHLDGLIARVAAPAWRDLHRAGETDGSYFWLMRYGKRGEHLKLRLHGPAAIAPHFESLLAPAAAAYFAALPPAAAPPEKKGWVGAPPIDAEDDEDADAADRSLVWTHYGRSHVSLGGKPFLTDDRYAELMTRCLAAGCEVVLALDFGDEDRLPHRIRQTTLLKALIGGLAALGFDAGQRADYLAYHRDWLLRFILPRDRRSEADPVEQLRRHFDTRVDGMGSGLTVIGDAARASWVADSAVVAEGAGDASGATGYGGAATPDLVWRRSLANLLAYIRPFCADPDYQLDPFASDPAFAPLFKVFHGLGNQLGLNLAEEAFAHHILLRATAEVNAPDAG